MDFLRWYHLSLNVENVPIKTTEMSIPGIESNKRRHKGKNCRNSVWSEWHEHRQEGLREAVWDWTEYAMERALHFSLKCDVKSLMG